MLEPGTLDPESSALTIRSPRLHYKLCEQQDLGCTEIIKINVGIKQKQWERFMNEVEVKKKTFLSIDSF